MKAVEQAVADFNASDGKVGYEAYVVDEEGFGLSIRVKFLGQEAGFFFENVDEFERWAYEGGESV